MLSVLTTVKEKDTWERPLSCLYPSFAPSSESICFFTGLLSHFPPKFKITKYFLCPRKTVFLFIGGLINVKHLKAVKVIHQNFIPGHNALLSAYVFNYICWNILYSCHIAQPQTSSLWLESVLFFTSLFLLQYENDIQFGILAVFPLFFPLVVSLGQGVEGALGAGWAHLLLITCCLVWWPKQHSFLFWPFWGPDVWEQVLAGLIPSDASVLGLRETFFLLWVHMVFLHVSVFSFPILIRPPVR